MSKNKKEVKRSWFFIILLTITSLGLAGTAAYFSIFGLAKLFYGAGVGVIILASVLELSKLVTVSYVYRYWDHIAKALRIYYIFGVVFIMLLTSIGIYGFLTSAYQNTANKVEMRDSQIRIAENKKGLFTTQLDRLNQNIESNNNRIDALTTARNSQENRLNNLYTGNRVSSARRTENQINSSDKQIETLNADITAKMAQSGIINDSIAYYDQKIIELKSSDISSEVGPLKYLADLTGISMNRVVNILVLLIIFVFDPMAITLLIGVNQLLSMEKSAPTSDKIKIPFIKIKKEEELEEGVIEEEPIKPPVKKRPIVPIILDEPEELIEDDENEEIQEDVIEPESKKNETPQQDCPDGYIQEKVNLTLDEIENGLTVNHSTFGDGKIIKFDKERSRVFIKFENETKELDPEYANLKRYNCLKVQQDPDAVPYIDFSMDDPEYTEIISQISKEEPIQEIVEEPIREEIEQNTEPVDEKKTKLFRKIWKGKRIV